MLEYTLGDPVCRKPQKDSFVLDKVEKTGSVVAGMDYVLHMEVCLYNDYLCFLQRQGTFTQVVKGFGFH